MKYLQAVAAIFVLLIVFASGIYGFWYVFIEHNMFLQEKHVRVCTAWNTNYYWIGWDGREYDTGTADIELARVVAGNRPITRDDRCKEYR